MTRDLVIGIDSSTTASKAVVWDRAGRTVADDGHADGGCRDTGVVVARSVQTVSWEVPKNSIGVFTLADGIRMTNQSDTACQGAVFTIPVQATGVSAAS